MNRRKWLQRTGVVLVCLGLTCVLNAQGPAAAGEVIRIDKPGVLDKPGATYLLTKDVTAPRTAFMVKGDDITLDLGGHTVTYGTEVGVDRCSGVFLRPTGRHEQFLKAVPLEGLGSGNRFTLKNGTIVQGQQPVAPAGAITYRAGRIVKEVGDHPRAGRSCFAVYVRACSGLLIEDITTEVNSRDTDNLYIRGCADVEVRNTHSISSVKEITDRHWPGTGIITVDGVGGPMNIHHNTVDGGGQWGIRVSGGGRTGHLVEVHHNIIRHRSRTTNGYAIGCHAPNMRVYANVVKSISRGIHLTRNNIDFYNNIVEPREKPNPEYPRTRTHGIKLEGATNSIIHHNFCRVVADDGFGDASPLDFSVATYSANRIYKNTFEAVRTTPKLDAYSVNLYSVRPESMTQVYENTFRTNHIQFRGDWGGIRGFTFANNRFEVLEGATDYDFFVLRQSSAVRTRNMVFRDNVLAPPADYRKVALLYANRYTRAHVDMTVEWSVNVKAVGPAGKPVAGVTVRAFDADDREVAQSVSDANGIGSVVLTDFHIIGNQGKSPIDEHGPYKLKVTYAGQTQTFDLDPKQTTDLAVTVTDPKRKLYVYAGVDQRRKSGETAKLNGNVVVVGDGNAKPEVTWRIARGKANWPIADPKSAKTTAVMTPNGSCRIELEAKWNGEVAKDTLNIRTDTRVRPVAVAVCPKTVKASTIVQLDASGSRDPRRFPRSRITYLWKQTAGPGADLSSPELPDPIFFPTQPGTYTFEVKVSNPIRTSEPASCTVVVTE